MKKEDYAKAPTRVRVKGGVRVKVCVKKEAVATNHAFKP